MTERGYDVPAAASGDAGIEGFSVEVGGVRVGRVAALNRRPEGLALVVDTGDDYRAIPASSVAQIETRGERVRLTEEGRAALAAAPAIEPRVHRSDPPGLVRHIPRELGRLVFEGEAAAPEKRSRTRFVGAVLAYVGAVALFITAPVAAVVGHGGLELLWILVPAAIFVAGATLVWRTLGDASRRRPTAREKAMDVVTFLLGVSPQTRRRG